ncbi:RNA-directed DNA polymerase [Aquipuribacter nitratireducens]|uniref:Reverse transcriptase domain-containing protein n=1 Tax=Aquipuribacter nitratireducens TaxID=650104 RepID=A0ABW0GNB5_9MICO
MAAKGSPDWNAMVDLELAAKNLEREAYGDWYRDPWGWPELRFAVKKARGRIHDRLSGSGTFQVALVDVPKENFGSRPAMVMDPLDRLIYTGVVDALSAKLIGDLSNDAFGWRLHRGNYAKGHYARNADEWSYFRGHIGDLSGKYEAALVTDIVSCFANVSMTAVKDVVHSRAGSGLLPDRLLGLVESWDNVAGRRGLPQRSSASAVLANAVLSSMDHVLSNHARVVKRKRRKDPSHVSAARWMDDMWLFGADAGRLRQAQFALQEEARSLGLDLNSGKTELLEGAEVEERVLEIEHSAVDTALGFSLIVGGEEISRNIEPLETLLERLIAQGETASRTSMRFATSRMRWHTVFDRVPDLLETAERMPHAADHLSRLFRDAVAPGDYEEWFLAHVKSHWATFEWSTAAFGTTLPSTRRPRTKTLNLFERFVSEARVQLPLFALAAQRLAAWDPNRCRRAAREAVTTNANPHYRRVVALAAVGAREPRTVVRGWLKDQEENRLTLDMLEAQNFAPAKVVEDFSGLDETD